MNMWASLAMSADGAPVASVGGRVQALVNLAAIERNCARLRTELSS